ncbi:hypothetical protein SFC43_10190 [Bacteroides sp. CR5/BHMF/2]|nr:hypothetical protein [Bacteroides sp. CR5/BHMF/2]
MPYGIQRMEGYDNSRSWGMPMLGFQVVGRNGELKAYVPTPENTTSMYQTAYSWTNSVSIERATEHVSTRIGFTNLRSDDVLEGLNKLTRNAFNVRSNVKLTKSLDVDLNGRYTHEHVNNRSYRNNSDRNPIYTLMDMPRDLSIQEMYPWKDENGKPTALQFKSPVWMLNELSNQDKKEWLLADVTVNYKLTKDLKLRLKAALDLNMKEGYEFRNMYTPGMPTDFTKSSQRKLVTILMRLCFLTTRPGKTSIYPPAWVPIRRISCLRNKTRKSEHWLPPTLFLLPIMAPLSNHGRNIMQRKSKQSMEQSV